MLSHGFLPNIVDKAELNIVNLNLKKFLEKNFKSTYFSEINNYLPSISKLINKEILSVVKKLLKNNNPILCNVELHLQRKDSQAIPPHQDNFYHCIKPSQGLKILIPLQPMDINDGALTFLDCDINFPIQKHVSSYIENFSSYIPSENFNSLKLKKTTYKYNLGDASYHFINSVHFSDGNSSNNETNFIVFRFQIPNATINKKALIKYKECLSNHKKLIKKNP